MLLVRSHDFNKMEKSINLISEEELHKKTALWWLENKGSIVKCNHLSAWFHRRHCSFIKDPTFNNGKLRETCGDCEVER